MEILIVEENVEGKRVGMVMRTKVCEWLVYEWDEI